MALFLAFRRGAGWYVISIGAIVANLMRVSLEGESSSEERSSVA
jgi:hypothetical protein